MVFCHGRPAYLKTYGRTTYFFFNTQLRTLRKDNLPQQLQVTFYRCSIESVLTHGIRVWYGNCSVADKKALQRFINTVQKIANTHLPDLEGIYSTHSLRKALAS
ncbi:hypothetical protein DPEC_G00259120 [Dallia pectoralis]|uniref:Uncharacterized protein n=1 Tax=Dallia pectoralis TaxID=75939 RepID=A0ACC2FQZ1_DALPE|nr:hypothetical protein DPEC_G00259120 [Dallia pectoralis]